MGLTLCVARRSLSAPRSPRGRKTMALASASLALGIGSLRAAAMERTARRAEGSISGVIHEDSCV